MALAPGTRLGPYEVLSPLGAGGMGDVFRARDTRLGRDVAVTADAALDWSPFWSGDGRFLHFSSNRGGSMNLWRVGIDEGSGKTRGRPEPVTVPASWAGPFRSTPDGSRAVFPAVEWETILDRVPFDPATEQVTGPATPLARFVTRLDGPCVSPDGALLALATLGSREDLLILRPDGSGLRRLTDDAFLNRDSHFTPDGRALVFHSSRTGVSSIWQIGVDGGGLALVVQGSGKILSAPIPSPDGKRLALQWGFHDFLLTTWPRAADAPLPPPEPRPGEDLGFWPNAWSRDSGRLVGTLTRENALPGGVAVYEVGRREWRRLTETGSFPLFLRDGRRVAFWDGNAVSLVDDEGGRTRGILRFEEPRRLQGFGLAPDDSQLYVLRATFQADLWVMDLAPRD
jgi:hypothetical protein